MTRQKFYEECVLRTFRRAYLDDKSPFHSDLNGVGNVLEMNLSKILMKMDILGRRTPPRKENFKEWGVRYLCQLLGFVFEEKDCDFTRRFFSFLKANRSLYRKPDDRRILGDVCYYAFTENIMSDRDFTTSLASFMIFEFKGEEWFSDFLGVAYALALLDMDGMDEYQRITRGRTFSEEMKEILDGRKDEHNG